MVAYGYHWSIKTSQKSWEFLYPESVTLWNVILKQTVKFFVKHSLYYCPSILFASASGQSFIERDGIQVNCIIYSSSVHFNLQRKQKTLLRTMEWSKNTAANNCGCLPSVVIIAPFAFALTVLADSLFSVIWNSFIRNMTRNSVILSTSQNDKTTAEKRQTWKMARKFDHVFICVACLHQ